MTETEHLYLFNHLFPFWSRLSKGEFLVLYADRYEWHRGVPDMADPNAKALVWSPSSPDALALFIYALPKELASRFDAANTFEEITQVFADHWEVLTIFDSPITGSSKERRIVHRYLDRTPKHYEEH